MFEPLAVTLGGVPLLAYHGLTAEPESRLGSSKDQVNGLGSTLWHTCRTTWVFGQVGKLFATCRLSPTYQSP